MTDCRQLLADYAQRRSEPAFRELVARYLDLVYSSALRLVDGDAHRAKDVAQIVFANLARKAGELSPDVMLGGWLHRHTCFVAANMMRGERRRLTREREAAEMNSLQENAGTDFTRLAPLLDETINQLAEADRTAILLRFFEQKDFRAVGQSLDASEDAARMRVNRALEKLRDLLAQRGIRTTAGALGIVITANAVQAAPVGLAVTISATALAGTAATTSSLIAATTKTIAMTTLQKTLVAATVAVLAGAGIYEARQSSQLRNQVQTLQQQQAQRSEQVQELQRERDDMKNRLSGLLAENARLKSNSNENELLKLRGEVTRFRYEASHASEVDSREAEVKSWLDRRDKLKQLASQFPDKSIPEFQLLSEQQWLDAAMNAKFDTDKGTQHDLADLRRAAENNFASIAKSALSKYMKANNNQFPTDLSQLEPYFSTPVDEAILQRWEIAPASVNPGVGVGNPIITEKAAVDKSSDQRWAIGARGYGSGNWESSDVSAAMAVMKQVTKAYAAANNGQQPSDPSQILPYLTTPEQQAAYQTLMKKFGTNQLQ